MQPLGTQSSGSVLQKYYAKKAGYDSLRKRDNAAIANDKSNKFTNRSQKTIGNHVTKYNEMQFAVLSPAQEAAKRADASAVAALSASKMTKLSAAARALATRLHKVHTDRAAELPF